jgi:cytochrome oxidase Cu insertion factor (SCO1/SenC/PrrC family)
LLKATVLWFTVVGWLVGAAGLAAAREHYPQALGIMTTERGREAPDVSLTDSRGKVHRLREYQGRVVLLGFGATW